MSIPKRVVVPSMLAAVLGLTVPVAARPQMALTAPGPMGESGDADLANADVLRVAKAFEGGGYNRSWGGSGTPIAIEFDGQVILPKGTGGTYCCGYTFAVAMLVAEQRGLLSGKAIRDVKRFQRMWYGAYDKATERNREIRERQCQEALQWLEVGVAVEPREAQAGDFLQFWRQKSGHSVIFLGWVVEGGEVVGVRYRSSQGSTDGIADRQENFAGHGGSVDPERMYFARMNSASH